MNPDDDCPESPGWDEGPEQGVGSEDECPESPGWDENQQGHLMNPDDVAVYTTNREPFTYGQAGRLAWLVWLRFGRDYEAACSAWCRMLQNNASHVEFVNLVAMGRQLEDTR